MKDVKKFFLKTNEPTYLKTIKINIIEVNCCNDNFGDVINELTEYMMDSMIVKDTLEALDRIIMKME